MGLRYTELAHIQADIKQGKTSCEALVLHYLAQISAKNAEINAFLEVYTDEALAQAKLIDAKIAAGTAGSLAGLVLGIKDLFLYKGHVCSAGSKMLEHFVAMHTSTALQRLLDQDAIVIGRQNCDEFAMGSSNENSAFGTVRNPYDTQRVAGGSSGGSAAAVAADFCFASIATDTGGSIRQPAAFCGLVGLKPTYGRVSRYGVVAYASSLDQVGTITHTVQDAALLFSIMAGKDPLDATTATHAVPTATQINATQASRQTIAVLAQVADQKQAIHPQVWQAYEQTIEKLKAQNHTIITVDFDYLKYAVATYYLLTTAESSSNLARYSGVLFGHRSPHAQTLSQTYLQSRTEGFGAEVKRRIMLGNYVLSADYYDAYYTKAQQVRRLIHDQINQIFAQAHCILMPVTPTPAFEIGQKTKDPIQMYLEDIFTVTANLAGVAAIAFPAKKSAQNLPIGMQLLAPAFAEAQMIALAKQL